MQPPRRYERFVWFLLTLLVIFTLTGLVFTYFKKPAPQIRNYVGQTGNPGLSVVGPQGNSGFQGTTGLQGVQGATGAQGPSGPQGAQGITGPQGQPGQQGDQGPAGVDGQDGKQIVFRCAPNGSYQFQYAGDESWQTIEKNSQACKQAGL